MERPPFDIRICKIEIDRWFNAKKIELEHPMNLEIFYNELKRAKRVLDPIFMTNIVETLT